MKICRPKPILRHKSKLMHKNLPLTTILVFHMYAGTKTDKTERKNGQNECLCHLAVFSFAAGKNLLWSEHNRYLKDRIYIVSNVKYCKGSLQWSHWSRTLSHDDGVMWFGAMFGQVALHVTSRLPADKRIVFKNNTVECCCFPFSR